MSHAPTASHPKAAGLQLSLLHSELNLVPAPAPGVLFAAVTQKAASVPVGLVVGTAGVSGDTHRVLSFSVYIEIGVRIPS